MTHQRECMTIRLPCVKMALNMSVVDLCHDTPPTPPSTAVVAFCVGRSPMSVAPDMAARTRLEASIMRRYDDLRRARFDGSELAIDIAEADLNGLLDMWPRPNREPSA